MPKLWGKRDQHGPENVSFVFFQNSFGLIFDYTKD